MSNITSKKYLDYTGLSYFKGKLDDTYLKLSGGTLTGNLTMDIGKYISLSVSGIQFADSTQPSYTSGRVTRVNNRLYMGTDGTQAGVKTIAYKSDVDEVKQELSEQSVDITDNVLIKISGISDNLALPPESQMEIESIEANSVVVNQEARELNATYWQNNTSEVAFNNGIATFTATAQNGGIINRTDYAIPFLTGHKYLICCDIKTTTATDQIQIYANGGYGSAYTSATTNWQTLIFVFNGVGTDLQRLQVRDKRTSDWDAIQVKNVFVIDLTQWFGSNDLIPQDILDTPSNFFKYYKGSLAFDTGHIENGSGNLVDTNRNIWDEISEKGAIDVTTGNTFANDNYSRSKNFIEVNASTTYYLSKELVDSHVVYYDINHNFISGTGNLQNYGLFSTPANCKYIKFYWARYLVPTFDTICLNVSDTSFNGTYVAHVENTLDFGNDTLLSACSVRDTKTPDGTITRNVSSVDLSELTFLELTNYYYAIVSGIKKVRDAKGITSKYTQVPMDNINTNTPNTFGLGQIDANNYGIYVSKSSGTPSGTLQFELETPTTEQGTPFDPYLPVYYGGQEFTTGDVPFVINKNYDISIKDQVITNVRVDANQEQEINFLKNNYLPLNGGTLHGSDNNPLAIKGYQGVGGIKLYDYNNVLRGIFTSNSNNKPVFNDGTYSRVLAYSNDLNNYQPKFTSNYQNVTLGSSSYTVSYDTPYNRTIWTITNSTKWTQIKDICNSIVQNLSTLISVRCRLNVGNLDYEIQLLPVMAYHSESETIQKLRLVGDYPAFNDWGLNSKLIIDLENTRIIMTNANMASNLWEIYSLRLELNK